MRLTTLTLATTMAASAGLAGCQTYDPYTGDKETSKATIGAGIGALAGAVIGYASGGDAKERRKKALIGAAGGGLAGGAVGYYMDQQEAKLRHQLQGTGVSVTRNGENITLNMPGNITFQTGSADMNDSFFKVLDSVGLVLKEFDKTLIVIAGHTDNVGSPESNQALSQRRAEAVGSYLATRNVVADRMVITGYGESQPVADNKTADGRQKNRRVELTLEPIKQG